MGTSAFTDKAAKAEVADAIREIERVTSAEVVVAVRASSGHYRHTDYLVGFALSFAALLVFLFDEHEFSIEWMPVDSIFAFALGAFISGSCPPLRRLLTSRSLMQGNVTSRARATFVELGIGKTSARTGILVYVSMFEKSAQVVCDGGIDATVLGAPFATAIAALDAALHRGPSFPGFTAALRSLGPILGKTLPRRVDDINELPDEPHA
jgi:putative membrane protein